MIYHGGLIMYTALDRYKILLEEIRHAEKQLAPHDTGHISTAISWMSHRTRELEEQINAALHTERH